MYCVAGIIQAKVYASNRCADLNLERNYRGRDIAILMDSPPAMKVVSSYSIDSKMLCQTSPRQFDPPENKNLLQNK